MIATAMLSNILFRLKQPKTIWGWIVLVFGSAWGLLGHIQNIEWLAEKWPKEWAVPSANWAWLPLLLGLSWLVVSVVVPDRNLPSLRHFAPQVREHPKSPGMVFMVIPIRNESVTTELVQLSAFLEFRRGLCGKPLYVHDALWFDWFPEYGDRKIHRNETRSVVIAVGFNKDPKGQPALAVGFEKELNKPRPTSLREELQRKRWVSDGREIAMEDLLDGDWKVRVKINGYRYCFEFTQKFIVDGGLPREQ